MADDILEKLFGLIALIIVCFFIVGVISLLSVSFSQQQCQPYINTIGDKDVIITWLNSSLNETQHQLYQCKNDYAYLATQTVTKKDFEEIKGYYNLTQIQINQLNQKFDNTNNNYNQITNIINNRYTISLSLNLALGLELFGFAVFGNELIFATIQFFRKRKNGKKEHAGHASLSVTAS